MHWFPWKVFDFSLATTATASAAGAFIALQPLRLSHADFVSTDHIQTGHDRGDVHDPPDADNNEAGDS